MVTAIVLRERWAVDDPYLDFIIFLHDMKVYDAFRGKYWFEEEVMPINNGELIMASARMMLANIDSVKNSSLGEINEKNVEAIISYFEQMAKARNLSNFIVANTVLGLAHEGFMDDLRKHPITQLFVLMMHIELAEIMESETKIFEGYKKPVRPTKAEEVSLQ